MRLHDPFSWTCSNTNSPPARRLFIQFAGALLWAITHAACTENPRVIMFSGQTRQAIKVFQLLECVAYWSIRTCWPSSNIDVCDIEGDWNLQDWKTTDWKWRTGKWRSRTRANVYAAYIWKTLMCTTCNCFMHKSKDTIYVIPYLELYLLKYNNGCLAWYNVVLSPRVHSTVKYSQLGQSANVCDCIPRLNEKWTCIDWNNVLTSYWRANSCVNAVDHIVAPSPSNNTRIPQLQMRRKLCIWICAWNNYVLYTLVCVHFIVCSIFVCSCSTPSFSSPANSSPANSAIPNLSHRQRRKTPQH